MAVNRWPIASLVPFSSIIQSLHSLNRSFVSHFDHPVSPLSQSVIRFAPHSAYRRLSVASLIPSFDRSVPGCSHASLIPSFDRSVPGCSPFTSLVRSVAWHYQYLQNRRQILFFGFHLKSLHHFFTYTSVFLLMSQTFTLQIHLKFPLCKYLLPLLFFILCIFSTQARS